MSVEDNKTVARGFIEQVWNLHRPERIEQFMAEDTVHHNAPGMTDREKIQGFVELSVKAIPDFHMSVEQEITEGDLVVQRGTITGTQQGELPGMPASGKTFSVPTINIFRIADGKIAEIWGITDTVTMMQQLGALPAPAAG